jgi:hypothetical protein
MTAAKTRYDKLFEAYEQFTLAIADLDDPMAATLCASWDTTKRTYEQALASGTRQSQLAAGMEQGLRELPMALRAEGGGKHAGMLEILHRSIAANVPEFFRQDESLLAAVVARGKIRNAREYYLVRHRIDELEGDAGALQECALLVDLVDRFAS